jgi:hypothetical protein
VAKNCALPRAPEAVKHGLIGASGRRLAMTILLQLRNLYTPHLHLAVAAGATTALDGRTFEGVVIERGKTSGDADTIIFRNGRFRSTACDPYEYGDGAYTVSMERGAIAFEAETESPKYGKLLWKGVVNGKKLDGAMTMIRDGKAAGEKCLIAVETT